MRAFCAVPPTLALTLALLAGCSYQEMSERPYYAEAPLHSLCEHEGPLTVGNRGIFQNRHGGGEVLLVGQLTGQSLETYLGFRVLRLVYVPDSGLEVTLVDVLGAERSELIPAQWISCADNAMELELPSDAFYYWSSVGVNTRRLRLQVAADGGLVLQHLWEEKGMAVMVLPLKFSGDGWARFPPDNQAAGAEPLPTMAVGAVDGCPDLAATYSADGTGVKLDGTVAHLGADAHFFRPETAGDHAMQPGDAPAIALRVVHTADGDIDLTLLRADGTQLERRLDGPRLSCDHGRWLAKGTKDWTPALMMAMGSMGARWEDLVLWRDLDGSLLVHGIYRSRGAFLLIPVGATTEELFVRFELLRDQAKQLINAVGPPPNEPLGA